MSLRACIIGGSLGGLFVGHFLRRAGWEISIHERTETPLSGRGAGIVTYPELEAMVANMSDEDILSLIHI